VVFVTTPDITTASFLFIIHSSYYHLTLQSLSYDIILKNTTSWEGKTGLSYQSRSIKSKQYMSCMPSKEIIFSFILQTKVWAYYTRLPWVTTCLPLQNALATGLVSHTLVAAWCISEI
jgi:hypothetical protein